MLRLKERPAEPGHAHVLVELAKHVDAHLLDAGTLLKAGKDDTGADAHFAVDRDLVANTAVVAELKKLYRHPIDDEPLPLERDRIFAAPTANVGESWDPFADRLFQDGALTSIAMPPAEVGFAIASHYLWLAEGTRRITVELQLAKGLPEVAKERVAHAKKARSKKARSKETERTCCPSTLRCRLTTAKGWLDIDRSTSSGVAA